MDSDKMPTTKKVKPQSLSPARQKILTGILLLIVAIGAGFAGGYVSQNNKAVSTSTQQQIVSTESQLISQLAKDVGPSVVSIDVSSQAAQQSIFGPRAVTRQSAGTGVILSAEGVVVTNRHVIPANTTKVSVTLSDGTQLNDVEVIGRTNDNDTLDIAFLKIKDKKGKDLKPAKLGDSSKVQVGDKVIAIGNALGQFQNTVTSGIISGYGRSVEAGDEQSSETLQNLFQTDASINEGNSGGPLVNMNGEVIAINTAVAGGGAENIGFAIPINDIQGLIKSVLKEGKLLRPYLGVRYVSLTDEYAYQYNLDTKRGAYIVPSSGGQTSIVSGSPAEKAGLKEKDIIVKVNDQPINEENSLISVLGRSTVGDKVTLTIIRDGKEQQVEVTLEAAPQN
jgi:S1-C subfamily serine protease